MDAPMDPCLGRSSTSLTPVPATVARASVMSVTPYPTWWIPSPRRARNRPTGVSGDSGLADTLLFVLLQGQHLEAERLPVHVDGPAQIAAGDANVVQAGQQR